MPRMKSILKTRDSRTTTRPKYYATQALSRHFDNVPLSTRLSPFLTAPNVAIHGQSAGGT